MLRQDEARRRSGEVEIPLRDRLRKLLTWPLVVAVSFWAAASMTLLSGSTRLPYYLGQQLKRPVLSRVNFERTNETRTAEARKAAQQDVPNYYRLNHALVDSIVAEIRDLYAAVKIMVPSRPTDAERRLFTELARVSTFDPRGRRQ